MKLSFLAVAAFASIAACSPMALNTEVVGLETRASGINCTQTYCSVDSGCVCVDWPKNCSAFYTVQSGDTCTAIADKFKNFTVTQFYEWNENVGQTCLGLQAYVPACINVPGYKFTPPAQPADGTHYTPSQTPVPVMPNITSKCTSYELIAPGTTVAQLAKANGFKPAQFPKWNGNSSTAWDGYWACVKV